MAQFYTLDEAAQRLSIPVDEFKRRTKTEWTSLRPFRDGATLRYRAADIDELARALGAASDPGLPLGPVGSSLGDSSEEMALTADSPIDFGPDGDRADDIFTLAPGADSARSSGAKPPGDSDVRLDMSPKSGKLGRKPTSDVSLDPPKEPSSTKLTAPKSGSRQTGGSGSGRIPSPAAVPPADSDSSSEFELRLDADSDSFELPMEGDAVDLGVKPKPNKGPQSGINLGKPTDSGVSLEKQDDSDMDFELSLDAPSPASGKLGPRTGPIRRDPGVDSSSEFELTLDDSSSAESFIATAREEAEAKGDIFETDFDLPAVDESGSEVVAVDADDDGFEVDVASDEVASVTSDDAVEVEEDDAPAASPRRALRDDDDYASAATRTVVATAPPWGPLPAAVLLPCLVILFLGSLMSFEAVRGMWGYHQPSRPAGSLVRGVAETIGTKVAD